MLWIRNDQWSQHICLTLLCDWLSPWNYTHSGCRQREAAHIHAAPLSHKVHKVPTIINCEKVLFLTAGYRSTFLVSVYHATLFTGINEWLTHKIWNKNEHVTKNFYLIWRGITPCEIKESCDCEWRQLVETCKSFSKSCGDHSLFT